jgi:hypothetical protein
MLREQEMKMHARHRAVVLSLFGILCCPGASSVASTINNFDGGGTPYSLSSFGGGTAASISGGGTGGSQLLLLAQGSNSQNSAAFDQTDSWITGSAQVAFDLRLDSTGSGTRSLQIGLLDTSIYGTTGAGPEIDPSNLIAQNSLVMNVNFDTRQASGSNNFNEVPPTNPQAAAAQHISQIQQSINEIMAAQSLARQKGDVVAVQSIDNELSNANTALSAAKDKQSQIPGNSADGQSSLLSQISQFAQSARQSVVNAQNAVGGAANLSSDSEEETDPFPPDAPDPDASIHSMLMTITPDENGSEVTLDQIVGPNSFRLFDGFFTDLFPYLSRLEIGAQTTAPGAGVGVDNVDAEFNVPEPGIGGIVLAMSMLIRLRHRIGA